MVGIVSFWSKTRGFGFIKGLDEKRYFVFYKDLYGLSNLKESRIVEFETKQGEKGVQAVNVRYT